jgi:hypothetical protein
MNEHQLLAIAALERYKGDDTQRARAAFRGMSTAEMHEQHGRSGKSRARILADYVEYDERVDAAIAWVKSVK